MMARSTMTLRVVPRGLRQGRREFGGVVRLGDADRGAEIGRLDEQGEAEARDGGRGVQRGAVAAAQGDPLHNGQPERGAERLNCSLSIDAAEAKTPAPT